MIDSDAAERPTESAADRPARAYSASRGALTARAFAASLVAVTLVFLLNNHLNYWVGWPGVPAFFSHYGWFGYEQLQSPLTSGAVWQGWLQLLSYPGAVVVVSVLVMRTGQRSLRADADLYTEFSAYIIRAAFWAVFIVGLVDVMISFLRVEGFMSALLGAELDTQLGRPSFRGTYVHWPLIFAGIIIAIFTRGPSFIWLTLLVVAAEFLIVISRFVFSYEHTFMGDLVRFWYAALFLFASAYALIDDGHVRVDVFYAHFSIRGKAWTNALGSILLGIPLCWVILTQGMWTKGSSINSPLLSFEISQSGFGMYTKYMMAGYLVVFALTMAIQFAGYFLDAVADLRGDPGHKEGHGDLGIVPHR